MSFFKRRTRVQQPDTRGHLFRAQDHYNGMEVRVQRRIDELKDIIAKAEHELRECEGVLASVQAAQTKLHTFIEATIDHYEEQIALSVADLRIDETDPTMPMGESEIVRVGK